MRKIDISQLKIVAKQLPQGMVRDIIEEQKQTMDLEDFFANLKAWERALKKGGQRE